MIQHITDGHTYGMNITTPIIHESAESALIELEEILNKLTANISGFPEVALTEEFTFANINFFRSDFYEYDSSGKEVLQLPTILTVDEWFNEIEELRKFNDETDYLSRHPA